MAKKANNVFTFLIFLHCWGTNYLMGIHPSDTRDTGGGISHRKQHSPHNSSHGCPRIIHGFLFSDMKTLVAKLSVTQSVIIRVIDNLSVKDTTANYHDHLLDQHLLPFTSCTAVLAAHDVYASLWRAESLAIDVVDKGGGLFLLISSLLYNCGATCHGHAERLGEYSLPVVHGDCHGDYAAVRLTIV